MTVQSQLDSIYNNRGNILRLMRQFNVVKDGEEFYFRWEEIPLDENDFNNAVNSVNASKRIIRETKEALNNIIGTAEDGKVVLINTSIYGRPSFTVKVRSNNKTTKNNDDDLSDTEHTWKVIGTDGLHRKFRTIKAKTKEEAIKNALYSLEYDNKQKFTLYGVECLN